MSATAIQAALDTLLIGAQSALIDIAWEGVPYTAVDTTPYLATRMAALTRRPLGPGADAVIEWSGRYQISVNVPVDFGKPRLTAKADELLGVFRRGLSLTTTDEWLVRIAASAPAPAVTANGWLSAPVLVDWFAHEFPV